MLASELAPSDWTQQTFEGHSSTARGIIHSIDSELGIGIITATSYARARGQYLVFFLSDIDLNNGWQQGIGEGDNVSFEISDMTPSDESYISDSYLLPRLHNKLSRHHFATNVSHLDNGSVILFQLLFDHPRYSGVVVTEATPSVQHHAFGSYYGDEEPQQGLIRLVSQYHDTQIPPISQRYNVDNNNNNNNNTTDGANDANVLLPQGTMVSFSGRDLLTTRIVVRKGDCVEFDVYRDIANSDLPFGATNIVFLDATKDSKRQHGFIYRFLSRPSSQYGSEQKFGLIKSTYHEELFWHQSEILDRDELVQIGDEVEFIREIDEIHGRLKASRITFLPKNMIQLTVLSSSVLCGKVQSSTSYNKSPLIEYSNPSTGSKQLIEVESMSSDHYILVKGDAVQFRLESQHENPTKKRAVHVVVTKEVDRTHKGTIYKLEKQIIAGGHGKQSESTIAKQIKSGKQSEYQYGEIEYHDRGGKKHSIYFYLSEWIDIVVDLYQGLSVEFNILESGTKKRAVRVRPLSFPLSCEERLIKKKEKERIECEEREKREQELRDSMLNEYKLREQGGMQGIQQIQGIMGRTRNKSNLKPPIINNSNNNNINKNSLNLNNINCKDNVSVDESNKSLSKGKTRRMRKQRHKIKNINNNNKQQTQSEAIAIANNSLKLTQANIDNYRERDRDRDRDRDTKKERKERDIKVGQMGQMGQMGGSNPIPSFDTMIPIEGIVVSPMRSKHGRGSISYEWKRKRKRLEEYEEYVESKTVEYDYDQKANWQRSIFLTEGDRVRLFFRSINENDASLAYVALLDPVYKQRLYGLCYYYHPTKNYYLQNNYGTQYIELWSYHIVDKKVQSYNLENELLVFDFSERINYNNDNKIATRCRWVRLDDKQWFNGRITSIPRSNTGADYGYIVYRDSGDGEEKQIRYSKSSLNKEYRNYQKCGDQVKFHIEHVVTKSTYDVIPPTAVHVDTTHLYRPKHTNKAIAK